MNLKKFAAVSVASAAMLLTTSGVVGAQTYGQPPSEINPTTVTSGLQSNPGRILPPSGSSCVGNASWDDTQLCFDVQGSGLYVSSMYATFYNRLLAGGIYGHLELQDTYGDEIANTPDVNVTFENTLFLNVDLGFDVPAGNYSGIFWNYQGGTYHEYQIATVNVHS
jgi:hypothetical protein